MLFRSASATSVLNQAEARPKKGSPEKIPAEVQAAMLKDFLDDHLKDWINSALPALGGLSPREAVRTRKGRCQVEDLLRQMEHLYSGGSNINYDIGWVREKLGL